LENEKEKEKEKLITKTCETENKIHRVYKVLTQYISRKISSTFYKLPL